MALSQTSGFTDGTSSDAIQSLFNKELLIRGTYELIHHMAMKKSPLPKRSGLTKIFRRYESLPLATTPLTPEGTNPTSTSKTKTDIAATIAGYGAFIENTNLLEGSQPEAVHAEDVELLGQQMGETIDQLDRDIYATATQTIFSNGASTAAVNTVLTNVTVAQALRLARANKAKPFVPMVMASQKIGTQGISPSYWGLCDEQLAYNLRLLPDFVLAVDYGNAGSTVVGEFGATKDGVRWMSSPNGFAALGGGAASTVNEQPAGTGAADVYSGFIVGQNAVASIDLAINNGGVITRGKDSGGTSDPLGLRITTGWLKYYTNVVLNQLFMVEIQTAVGI